MGSFSCNRWMHLAPFIEGIDAGSRHLAGRSTGRRDLPRQAASAAAAWGSGRRWAVPEPFGQRHGRRRLFPREGGGALLHRRLFGMGGGLHPAQGPGPAPAAAAGAVTHGAQGYCYRSLLHRGRAALTKGCGWACAAAKGRGLPERGRQRHGGLYRLHHGLGRLCQIDQCQFQLNALVAAAGHFLQRVAERMTARMASRWPSPWAFWRRRPLPPARHRSAAPCRRAAPPSIRAR